MLFTEIRQEILALAENDYKEFSTSLLPGVDYVLGVRLPQLRAIAKRIAQAEKGEWQKYLAEEPHYFEECMLQGMIIGAVKVPDEERLRYIAEFIPKINNWSVCDSFCSGLKFAKSHPEPVWEFIQPYLQSGEVYHIRFAVVMMMNYYLTDAYIDRVLHLLDAVRHDDYYVKMAVAWALATALAKQPEKTWAYFQQHHLDGETWRKTIQKCIESRRVPEEQKKQLREMRRSIAEK